MARGRDPGRDAVTGSPPAGSHPEPVNITMVTYNRLDFTKRSIESVGPTAGYPYELTVVDNASSDGTQAYLEELRAAGVIHRLILNERNHGIAYAANQGWAAGGKEHYLKLDNDIVFEHEGWLSNLVDACDRLPRVGTIGYNFEASSYPLSEIDGVRIRRKRGNIGGACVMIPRRVHDRVGYWCEDFWPYGEEDADMWFRIRELGLRAYYMEDEDVGLHLPEGKATPLLDRGRGSISDEGDPAYRAEKDGWRRRYGGRRGLSRINLALYRVRLRSTRIDHGVRYRPSLAARLFVLLRFFRLDPWAGIGEPGEPLGRR